MKTIILAVALATAALPALADTHLVKGSVTKVDVQWKKVTIDHAPLTNLDMPAMKMVFQVADPEMLEGLAEGDEIDFLADRVNGKLTVVELVK
jgi:Cu/Ag efflux protein CusF